MGFLMRIIRLAFGTVAIMCGLLMVVLAFSLYQNREPLFAVACGTVATVLFAIGYRSTRQRRPATGLRRGRNPFRRSSWRDGPATAKQREFAKELGIKYGPGITKGELSDLISQVTGR